MSHKPFNKVVYKLEQFIFDSPSIPPIIFFAFIVIKEL